MPRRPIIRKIGFPEIRLIPNSTIAIPISGRRLSGIRSIEVLLVGDDNALEIPRGDWLEINESLILVKYTVPDRVVLDSAELEITVTNDDGSDGTIYP